MIDADEEQNYTIFRECLSELVTSRLAPTKERRRVKGRKNEIKPVAKVEPEGEAVEELGEFIDVSCWGRNGSLEQFIPELLY